MTDAEATLSDLPRLLVPIDVQALLAGDQEQAGDQADDDHQPEQWLNLVPDFTKLFRRNFLGSQFEPAIEEGNETDPLPAGVHLHWALPDALCRGEATGQGLTLPAIPNRWFILRLVLPDETTKVLGLRAWIVESDYAAAPDDLTMTGNPWPSPRLWQSSGPTAKQDFWFRVGKAFHYGGQGLPEPQWTEVNSKKSLAQTDTSFSIKLTALGYGDPAFCASYPAGRNLLGFHDPLDDGVPAGATVAKPVALTYLVAGWYANPADDPLHGYTAAPEKWNARLEELRWRTPDPILKPPNQILCHGLIQGIRWQGKATRYPVQDTSGPHNPNRVALGNNDVEALTTALGASFPQLTDADVADLFAAFQFNVLTGVAEPGGDHELTASLHERTFGRYPGGTRWEIVESPGTAAPGSAVRPGTQSATVVPDRVARALRRLNDAQRRLDSAQEELRSYQEEIYATWYKAFLASGDPNLVNQQAPLQNRLKWLRDDRIPASRAQIAQESAARDQLKKELQSEPNQLKKELRPELEVFLPGFQLQVGSEPYWSAPNDPVVLISGAVARVSRRHGEDGRYSEDGKTLLCRDQVQTISSWTVRAPGMSLAGEVKITAAVLPGSANFPQGRPIPRAIAERLFAEALLLEPRLSAFLAGSAATKGGTKDRWKATLDRVLKWVGDESRNPKNDSIPPREIGIEDKVDRDGGWPIAAQKPVGSDLGQVRFEERFPSAIALNSAAVDGQGRTQNPWLPLHLVWKVEWQAFASKPDEMLRGWSLDPERIEFTFQPQGGTTPAAVRYSGLTVLTPGGTVNLKSRLKDRLEVAESTELRNVYENVCRMDVLSQSLSGLTEQLVMKKMRPELPLLDPKTVIPGFDAAGVRHLLKPQRGSDPIPKISPERPSDGAFFPIRAGTLEVKRLCIVDAFGRMRELDVKETKRSPRLTPRGKGGGAGPAPIFLEPRLSSPARLVMQWRNPAAPAEPAVCGWLLPNILDRSFVVLDARGRALGTLQRRQADPLQTGNGRPDALASKDFAWVPIPPMKMPANPADPLPTGHGYLGGFIRSLLTLTGARGIVYDELFSGLETTQGGVNHPGSARSPNLAALMGRPLALLRASLKLELAGLGPLAQGWDSLSILDPKKGGLGLDLVKFPVFLGHPVPGLDGLVGYFVLSNADLSSAEKFHPLHMAFGLKGTDSDYVKYKSSAQQVSLSQPLELLLLLYPEAGVTVTSGILPRQTFRPEPSDGGADLEESDVYFYTGPVVSLEAELSAPRPSDAYGQWSWTHRQDIDIWAPEEKLEGNDPGPEQPFGDLLQLREGWLKLVAHPLAIDNFSALGREPRQEPKAPLHFDVPAGQGYVLAWTVSGADRVELTCTRDGRAETLFQSRRPPHPTRYAVAAPGGATAAYTLAAWRGDGTTERMIIVTSTGK